MAEGTVPLPQWDEVDASQVFSEGLPLWDESVVVDMNNVSPSGWTMDLSLLGS